jgi:hypothetical protein
MLWSLAVVAATPVVYVAVFVVIEETLLSRDEQALICTSFLVGIAFIGCWLSIWAPQVRWTQRRRGATFVITLGSIIMAAGAGAIIAFATREEEIGAIAAGGFWAPLWIGATASIWRETATERAARLSGAGSGTIRCPACGYNMTGLTQARCPECGRDYTLDELFAAARPDGEPD